MILLDTDHVSALKYLEHSRAKQLVGKLAALLANEVIGLSIITVEEQLSAWYTLLRRAKTATDLVPVYRRMTETVRFLSRLPLLTSAEAAAHAYENLRKQKPRTGRMDLRIAAAALTRDCTLLTRNTVDFERVPGLRFEDWTM